MRAVVDLQSDREFSQISRNCPERGAVLPEIRLVDAP